MKQFKIIVEKHPDGYVAYPLGFCNERFENRWINIENIFSEGLDMKKDCRFHVRKSSFISISLPHHNALIPGV